MNKNITVLFFKDDRAVAKREDGRLISVKSKETWWIGTCLEYDICVQGKTVIEAAERLNESISVEYWLQETKAKGFDAISKAPEYYWNQAKDIEKIKPSELNGSLLDEFDTWHLEGLHVTLQYAINYGIFKPHREGK
jgi:hypothetical protein